VVTDSGSTFYFYDPAGDAPPDRRFPFATLVTNDAYDRASQLDRPEVFRLNVGVSRETYRSLFDQQAPRAEEDGIVDTGHDFTELDRIMPHPIYAPQFWVCVLNPSDATFQDVRPLLAEAYGRAVSRHARQRPAGAS